MPRTGRFFTIRHLDAVEGGAYRRWVHAVIAAAASAYATVTLVDVLVREIPFRSVYAQALTTAVLATAWWWARLRPDRIVAAAVLAAGAGWLEVMWSIVEQGYGGMALTVLPLIVVGVGLLFGGRAAFGVAAASAALAPVAAWAGARLAPQWGGAPPSVHATLVLAAVLLVAAAVIDHAMRTLGRAVALLREREAQVRELVMHAPDGILALDEHGVIQSVNPAAERILGAPGERLLGRSVDEALRERGADGPVPLTDLPDGGTVLALRPPEGSGPPVPVEVGARRFHRSDGREAVQLTLRDVSERMRREASERERRARMEAASRLEAVGRLAAGVAHDFNNRLTAIGAAAELLLEEGPEEVRALATTILEAKVRATELTRGLLAFGRKQVVQPRHLTLDGVVRDLKPLLESLVGDGVTLELRLEDTPPVFVDRAQVEHAVVNLVQNARDAVAGAGCVVVGVAPPGAAVPTLNGSPRTVPPGYVELCVGDDGGGMDARTRELAVEPFFSTSEFGSKKGLGLAVVHGTVMQAGGRMELESAPGRGTIVRTLWPVSAESAEVAAGDPAT